MGRFVDWVAPLTWAGVWARAAAVVAAIHVVNVALAAVIAPLNYSLADATVATLMATPMFGALMAALRQMRILQGQLTTLATTDVLTGLANRRAFLARTHEAAQGGRAGALLLLDADHFKRINDAHGHAVGDACLQAIAERLRALVRPGDVVGRLGGEEFAIFLPGATRAEAAARGARLCESIAVDARDVEGQLAVTLSAGAALSQGMTPLDRLMADADRALYLAKARGRGRVVVWPLEAPEEAAA